MYVAANGVQDKTHFPGENVNLISQVCEKPMVAQESGIHGTSRTKRNEHAVHGNMAIGK